MGTYYHQLKHPLDDVKIKMPEPESGCFAVVGLYADGEMIVKAEVNPDYLGVFLRSMMDPEPVAKRSGVGGGRTVTQLLRAPDKERMAVFVSEYGEVVTGAEWALPVAGTIVTGMDGESEDVT